MIFNPFGLSANYSPFRDLERLVEELHTTFNRTGARQAPRPNEVPLNLWSNEQGLVITAEIPGVDPASIGVNVLGDTVTITGKRAPGAVRSEDHDQRGTPQEPSFTRTVHLPYRVDADRTEARCSDGVLKVALHRPDAERPRTIPVKTA